MMARSDGDDGDGSGGGTAPSYEGMKHIIEQLSVDDRVRTDAFVDDAVVVETFEEQVPYEETIKRIEARVDLEGPRGDRYELTAGRFSAHETVVEIQPLDDSGRKAVSTLKRVNDESAANRRPPVFERARGETPPDPSLSNQEEWTITTIAKRLCSGPTAAQTVPCDATGQPVSLSEIHLYVSARRDPHPHLRYSTPEHTHWVLADADALRAWFANDQDSEHGGDRTDGPEEAT